MTVNTTKITSGPYVGNNIADTFSYTFKVQDKSQLNVYETTDNGSETLLTVDTDYTVAGVGDDSGGIITRVAGALPTDYQWYIRSDYKETQQTAFGSQGPFFPEIHENAADKTIFLIQQLSDGLDRTPRLSDSYSGVLPLSLSNPVAGKFLKWNDAEDGLENTDVSLLNPGDIDSLSIKHVFSSVAAYKGSSILFPVGKTIHLNDRDADFFVIAGNTPTLDFNIIYSTTVNQSITLVDTGSINLRSYGLVNGADVKLSIQAAIDNLVTNIQANGYYSGVTSIIIPAGSYVQSAEIISRPYIKIKSDGSVLITVSGGVNAVKVMLDDSDPLDSGKQMWMRGAFLDGTVGGITFETDGISSLGSCLTTGNFGTAGRNQFGRYSVKGVAIRGFFNGVAFKMVDNYLALFDDCHIEQNTNNFTTIAGSNVNSGENMRVVNSVCAGATNNVLLSVSTLDMNFIGGSIDFCTNAVFVSDVGAGFTTINYTGVYFESVDVISQNVIGAANLTTIVNGRMLIKSDEPSRKFKGVQSVEFDGFEIRMLEPTGVQQPANDGSLCLPEVVVRRNNISYSRSYGLLTSESMSSLPIGEAYFTDTTVGVTDMTLLVGWTQEFINQMTGEIINTDSWRYGRCLELTPVDNTANLTIKSDTVTAIVGDSYHAVMFIRSAVAQSIGCAFGIRYLDAGLNQLQYNSFHSNIVVGSGDTEWLSSSKAVFTNAAPAPNDTAFAQVVISLSPDSPMKLGAVVINKLT